MGRSIFVVVSLFFSCAYGQTAGVTLKSISNYNSWGWDAIVMDNGLITHSTVPAIGGRVMQYDLQGFPSIFVNPAEFGGTYTPAPNSNWYNFGGYKTWPAPQSMWNESGWPPPPNLDYGTYIIVDTASSPDSASVTVASPVEKWYAPGIRFVRKATMYSGTSRVRMEQTMINQGASDASWSLWSIMQVPVHHSGMKDYQNYWAYFPVNPNSVYGSSGVSYQQASAAWQGEVAPGVYGVRFEPDNQKIFADPDRGWIAYADLADTTVFARTYNVFEGETYPDSGSRAAVYVSSDNPAYMELEVTSPVENLSQGGGKYTFTENWWAARLLGPVLDVDSVGAVGTRLEYDKESGRISGRYGVFYEGTARVAFVDSNGSVVAQGESHTVSPTKEFELAEPLTVPGAAVAAELRVYSVKGALAGVLERESVQQLTTSVDRASRPVADGFRLFQNYPNPFNPSTAITYQLSAMSRVSLKVYDVLGREVAVLVEGQLSAGLHSAVFDGSRLPSGVYFYRLRTPGGIVTGKMILEK